MKKTLDDGGPAFPQVEHYQDGTYYRDLVGMSLRDYLAAKALQGEVACPSLIWDDEVYSAVARHAYRFADAMLIERANK